MGKRIFFILSLALAFWACDSDTERRTDYAVQGIDVSHHQARIQWDAVAAENIQFAFVKATEGATHADSLFCYNWRELKRNGIRRGAYHFYRPSVPADVQAHNFMSWVELSPGDLPPVLDIEVLDGLATPTLLVELKTWLFLIEIRYGIKPIIYTSLKFYNKHLAGRFEEYPLWIARYAWREPTLACGSQWQFWQYGNRGRIAGINGPVDLNVFQGDLKDLEALSIPSRFVLSQFSVTSLSN
jgi:lysozyme